MAEQNSDQVADWNDHSGEHWVAHQARLDAVLGSISDLKQTWQSQIFAGQLCALIRPLRMRCRLQESSRRSSCTPKASTRHRKRSPLSTGLSWSEHPIVEPTNDRAAPTSIDHEITRIVRLDALRTAMPSVASSAQGAHHLKSLNWPWVRLVRKTISERPIL
jgi:hypothetical protein